MRKRSSIPCEEAFDLNLGNIKAYYAMPATHTLFTQLYCIGVVQRLHAPVAATCSAESPAPPHIPPSFWKMQICATPVFPEADQERYAEKRSWNGKVLRRDLLWRSGMHGDPRGGPHLQAHGEHTNKYMQQCEYSTSYSSAVKVVTKTLHMVTFAANTDN